MSIKIAAAVQELWIRNGAGHYNHKHVSRHGNVVRPPRVSRRLYLRVSHTARDSPRHHRAKKLIVRYNSHNSKHLKCQPELIVATRSCDEARGRMRRARLAKATLQISFPVTLSSALLRGLIRSTKARCRPAYLARPRVARNPRSPLRN